ncbi:MAG: SET domain-containing protein-lysine N-methyltransferase [Patescibacteria group bacterium]
MNDFIISENNFGKAVIANKTFLKGDRIIVFEGKLMHRKELPSVDKIVLPEEDRYLQVSEEYFIGPSGKVDDIINHSCNPNSGVIINDRKAKLIALRDIKVGDEIAYDYSLQMYEEDWVMKCACGASNCRKIIREFKHLPLKVKLEYHELGVVPEYNLKFLVN